MIHHFIPVLILCFSLHSSIFCDSRKAVPMGGYVGELQERWQFPSDHIPVGILYEGSNWISWNVLDNDAIHWVIEKNSQGLGRSHIATMNQPQGDGSYTLRDLDVISTILQMIDHPTAPKQLLFLQECSAGFIEQLKMRLPSHFEMIFKGELATLYDTRAFVLESLEHASGQFSESSFRVIQDITLKKISSSESLRFFHVHLPGNPVGPAREELVRYVRQEFNPLQTSFVMGDMNFNELEMALSFADLERSFEIYTPYCTNISPYTFISKAIDHFIVIRAEENIPIRTLQPEEVLQGLSATLSLLQEGASQE